MSGIQEILVVLVVILILFYLPKRAGKIKTKSLGGSYRPLSGKMRLAVLASLIWLAVLLYLTRPWEKEPLFFVYFGFAPLLLAWGIFWVVIGFRKRP